MEWVKRALHILNGMHLLSLLRKHCNIHVIKQIFIEYLLISMHWAKRHSDPNEKKKWYCHLGDYCLAFFAKIKYWCVSAGGIRFIHSVFLVFLSGIFLSGLHIPTPLKTTVVMYIALSINTWGEVKVTFRGRI